MQTWSELQRRRLEDINDRSKTQAVAAWLIEAGFMGFGGGEVKSKPDDFLPFKLNRELRTANCKLSDATVAIFKQLVQEGAIPSQIVRDFWRVDGLQELVLGEN